MIEIDEAARIGIPMRGREDAPPAQLQRLLLGQIVAIFGIEHAVRERLAGPDAEEVAGQPGAVRVDVVEGGPLLRRDAGAHGAHRQAHALVRVHEVREDLGRGGDGDAALVSELVQAALHAQVREPVLAVLDRPLSGWPSTGAPLRSVRRKGLLGGCEEDEGGGCGGQGEGRGGRTAAPPAMVPSRQLLISITFLTV